MAELSDLGWNEVLRRMAMAFLNGEISVGTGGGGGSTAAKQDEIIEAINNLEVAPPEGGATEAEQQTQTTTLTNIQTALETPADELPPRMSGGLNSAVTTVAVNKADTGADTIAAADADEAWQMAGCRLSISGATTLTFDGGGVDLVLDVPSAGILDLAHDESGHTTGATNTAFTLSSSNAVTIKGVIKLQKGA